MSHRRTSSFRSNLRIGTGEGMLATPWVFLVIPGNFIVAALLTQHFRIDLVTYVDLVTYGLIASLPAWSNVLHILLLPWLSRFLTPKDLALGVGWFNIGLWTILAGALGFLPEDEPRKVGAFFILFFACSSLSHAFIGVGWTSWVRDWVPRRVQGTYFGRRNRWMGLVTVAFLLLALLLFEIAETALWPYQVLLVVAVVARYASSREPA